MAEQTSRSLEELQSLYQKEVSAQGGDLFKVLQWLIISGAWTRPEIELVEPNHELVTEVYELEADYRDTHDRINKGIRAVFKAKKAEMRARGKSEDQIRSVLHGVIDVIESGVMIDIDEVL